MLSELEKSILAAVVYFDIFDYPLTELEISKWLYCEYKRAGYSFSQIQSALIEPNLQKRLSSDKGFYFLPSRERIVDLRVKNYKNAERKFRKAVRFVKLLHLIPFIKMVAVCNSLAFSNAGDFSDIDFFIITKRKRIFLARLWANFLPKLLGLRPTRSDTQDKLCLTIFISEDKLDISSLKLIPADIYLTYWVSQIMPVYDSKEYYNRFLQANHWALDHFANFIPYQPSYRRQVKDNWLSKLIRLIGGMASWGLLGWVQELLAKKIQLRILPEKLRQVANKDTSVVINDQVLKFHDNDRRGKFQDMFEKKMATIVKEND